jgi:hypothetical protein
MIGEELILKSVERLALTCRRFVRGWVVGSAMAFGSPPGPSTAEAGGSARPFPIEY